MKIVMIGASIIAMTGMSAAIANPQFNSYAHSQAAVQLIADQDGNTDAMNPAPQTAPQQNGTTQPTDQNTNPDMSQDQTQAMQNTNAATDQPPTVSIPAAPAEQPTATQPARNDDSQNSY